MPIHINWYDPEQTIVRYEFEERWSWDELYDAVKSVVEMLRSVPHRVDIIFNVRRSASIPSGAIGHIRGLSMRGDDNWGIGVMVGGSTFIKTLLQIFIKLNPKLGDRYLLAETDESAVQLIAAHRAKAATTATMKVV